MSQKPAYEELEERVRELERETLERERTEETLRENTRQAQVAYDQAIIYAQQLKEEMAERKRTGKILRENEERFRNIFEQSPISIELYDAEGYLLDVNKSCLDLFGLSDVKEVAGFRLFEDPNVSDEVKQRLRKGKTVRYQAPFDFDKVKGAELYNTTKSGTIFLDVIITPLGAQEKSPPHGYLIQIQDITEKIHAEKALHRAHDQLEKRVKERTAELAKANEQVKQEMQEREKAQQAVWRREEEVRVIAENAPALISYITAEGTYTFSNRRYEEWFGVPRSDIIGKHYRQVLGEATHERIKDRIDAVLSGKRVHYEDFLPYAHGGSRWVTVDLVPDIDDEGKVKGFFAFVADITERMKAEKALEAQLQLEQIVAAVSSSFINMVPDEINDGINRALETIGVFSEVDRSYVFLFRDNNSKMDNTHEWCAQGIEPQIDSLKGLSADIIPWWMDRLNDFENIHIPCIAALPPEASAEKEILQTQDIQSLIVVPMVSGGSLLGFIGFDSVRLEKTWPEESITLLQLTAEIFANALARKQAEKALQQSNEELVAQTDSLETLNNALTVLLDRRDRDKEALEEKVVSNVKELVLPYVETLKSSRLDAKQAMCVSIVESNLQEIVSPFLRNLSTEYQGLTPKEIQVASLIKQGKTTKEIAELFNVSTRAVQFHRHNIREKLGLKNSQTNLATHLLSLS